MKTLEKCIEDFIENITVTDKQVEIIEGAVSNLSDHLYKEEENQLHVKEVFLNGSYVRDTMIRPMDDIDVFAVIDEDLYNSENTNPMPQYVLDKFKNYLNHTGEYKDKCRQDRPCITIDLSKFHIDVLPAMLKGDKLMIPNNALDGWQPTDPKSHSEALDKVDLMRLGMVKKVIRMVKKWKRIVSLSKLPSFHIEEIAIKIFSGTPITTYEEGMRIWFHEATKHLSKGRFDTESQYKDAQTAINETKTKLNDAKTKLDKGEQDEAKRIWKEVLKDKDFSIMDADEAKEFSTALENGTLRFGATGLSTTIGTTTIAASKGFYGQEK